MTEQEHEQDADVVSEQSEVQATDEQSQADVEPTMVPLAALQAERRKRQELQEFIAKSQQASQPAEEPEDPNGLVEKHVLQQVTSETKREILETLYQDMNPSAVQEINKYLQPILEKKPWLAASVDSAQNRYARAHEIVNDYKHLVDPKAAINNRSNNDGQRIVQNAQKPGSPVNIGKSAQPTGVEFLKSIQGKKEFREYRQKIRNGG